MAKVVAQRGDLDAAHVAWGEAQRGLSGAQAREEEAREVEHACGKGQQCGTRRKAGRADRVLKAVVRRAGPDEIGGAELFEGPAGSVRQRQVRRWGGAPETLELRAA